MCGPSFVLPEMFSASFYQWVRIGQGVVYHLEGLYVIGTRPLDLLVVCIEGVCVFSGRVSQCAPDLV